MAIKLACLNARGLKDRSKAAQLLHELSFGVDVSVSQETYFVCDIDGLVLFIQYGDRQARDVSLLAKHSLCARVDLVTVDAEAG